MMYLIYNNDGSLKLKNLCEVINRGDNNTKQLFVAIENRSNDSYSCIANFRLPDGTINQLTGVASTESIDSETSYDGFIITLTAAQTLYPGKLEMAVELLDLNDNVLFTYTTNFQVNDTPYDPDETLITIAQYNALVAAFNGYQVKFTANNVRKYSSASALEDDLENLAVGQTCLYKDTNGLFRIAEVSYDSVNDENVYEDKGLYLPFLNAAALQIAGNAVATENYVNTSIGTLDTFVKSSFAHSMGIAVQGNSEKIRLIFSLYDYNNTRIGSVLNQDIGSATTSLAGLLAAADKVKIDNIATDIATALATAKAYTDSQVSATYKYKGTKTVAQINALTGLSTGDVYNVSDSGTLTDGNVDVVAGDNVAWDGTKWDKLAGMIDLSGYATNTYVNQLNAENVKLTGNQEIAGSKTFSQDIKRKYGNNGGYTSFGSVPGSNVPLTILWKADNNASIVTLLRYETLLNGFRFGGNLLPLVSEGYNLGSATYKWNDAFIAGLLNNGTESITVKQIVDNFTDLTNNKQDTLVSGLNIKSLNGESLLGVGNIDYDDFLSNISTNAVENKTIKTAVDNINAEITKLRLAFEEAVVEIKTTTYSYLQWEALPSNIDGQPILFSLGTDLVNVKGNSFAFNQLVQNGNFESTSDWFTNNSSFNVSNNIATFTANSQGGYLATAVSLKQNHKYLISANIKLTTANTSVYLGLRDFGNSVTVAQEVTANSASLQTISAIGTSNYNSNSVEIRVIDTRASDWDAVQVSQVQLFDLTLMGIDTLTTLDQVRSALLERGINIDEYNAYNAGSIKNSKPTSLVVHHFNLWNEVWELGTINTNTGQNESASAQIRSKNYVNVIPNSTYYCLFPSSMNNIIFYYDKNKNFISRESAHTGSNTITTPFNAYYLRFICVSTTYNNDICINISNASLNGTYKPYQAPTNYALDLPILRGVGTVQDDVSKVYIGNYTFTGNENFQTLTENSYFINTSDWSSKPKGNGNIMTGVCISDDAANILSTGNGIGLGGTGNIIIGANDKDKFVAGTKIIYELATPTDQVAITLPDDIAIEDGDSFEITYDSTDNCGADFDFKVATNKVA